MKTDKNLITMIIAYLVLISFLASGLFYLLWRYICFIRYPHRTLTVDDDAVVSPADGYVCYCKKIHPDDPIFSIKNEKMIRLDELMNIDDETLKESTGWLIGIVMTVFNMHYNLSPITGHIRKIFHGHPQGKGNKSIIPTEVNMILNREPYYKDAGYLISNERASYIIKNKDQCVFVTQIADNWIRKIITFKDDQQIEQGEIFGMIKMGSQVDVFVPDNHDKCKLCIKKRQKVKAGVTKLLKKQKR